MFNSLRPCSLPLTLVIASGFLPAFTGMLRTIQKTD